jgi:hypothetical protein
MDKIMDDISRTRASILIQKIKQDSIYFQRDNLKLDYFFYLFDKISNSINNTGKPLSDHDVLHLSHLFDNQTK